MDSFVIDGGRPLRGTIRVNGSKNAGLPILIATLLTDEPCELSNLPGLRDIRTTYRLLESLGKRIEPGPRSVRIVTAGKLKTRAPYDIVKQMRASVLVAGPLLGRFGEVRVPIPGGCAIGPRPIDIHVEALMSLGAREEEEGGDVVLKAGGLKGRRFRLRFPSVGATENLMMAACLARGKTVISNAACEPEIEDLGRFLCRMGGGVEGAGTGTVVVRGVSRLHGASHSVIPDRIEAGTFLIAAAATGGRLRLTDVCPTHLRAVTSRLRVAGASVREDPADMELSMGRRLSCAGIRTLPYPGFPTDLQAPWMTLMCLARGDCLIRETVFENRFLHAAELIRMGAGIKVSGSTARISGRVALKGAPVMASDIRGGAALVVAALAAKGRSTIQRVYHIDRGYERLEARLAPAGARIRRVGA